jgi:tRNA nucleotidyltransferase/poly(A) polymerase
MQELDGDDHPNRDQLEQYTGRWVALLDGKVIGQGGTPKQALHAAKIIRYKESPRIHYVSTKEPLVFDPILKQVTNALPSDFPVYLVGGAVRDALLGRQAIELDFVVEGDVFRISRQLADDIGAAYFPLDVERETTRLVALISSGERRILDFASLRGHDLENDLRARDFTINAIAVDVRDTQAVLDPLGGVVDLYNKRLRECSESSFIDDPIRILRAVRIAAGYNLHIPPQSRSLMRKAVPELPSISHERIRDEIFKILAGRQPAAAIQALDFLGALDYTLPELPGLKGIQQSPPHICDVWNHSLDTLRKLDTLLAALAPEFDPENASNLILGMSVLKLGRFRQQIDKHLKIHLTPDRSFRSLLFFAALYHDVGKIKNRQIDEAGRIRFFGHHKTGSEITSTRARSLHLSNAEEAHLVTVVRDHMRPKLLAQLDEQPSRKAVYRFFRDTGSAGVSICLLSLADVLATYGTTLPQDIWEKHVNVVRTLLEAWWEYPLESISPPPLINGRDLIAKFDLEQSPLIGQLLESVRENQATGKIRTREEAINYVRSFLEEERTSGL